MHAIIGGDTARGPETGGEATAVGGASDLAQRSLARVGRVRADDIDECDGARYFLRAGAMTHLSSLTARRGTS